MNPEVAIIGIGWEGFTPTSRDYSYKELIYKAATKAYFDANVDPRKDIESFVTTAEDFIEGTSIFDEYTPDQLGAALKPLHTIAGESLNGLITAFMLIRSGMFNIVAVEAHSKASNVKTLQKIIHYAFDPVLNRPLRLYPEFVAGLEMQRFLYESGCTTDDCSLVVQKNRRNALKNPLAPYSGDLTVEEINQSPIISDPLRESHIAPTSDGAIVIVLASKEQALARTDKPIWIKGLGWCNDSYALEYRQWGKLPYVTKAARMAYSQAEIDHPQSQIDFLEIDDCYAYREPMTLTALGFYNEEKLSHIIRSGEIHIQGKLPVNPSGGSLGIGSLLDANGFVKVVHAALQLRSEAGGMQLPFVHTALVQSWRGIPTTSSAVVILSN